jgi:hypothetical protein
VPFATIVALVIASMEAGKPFGRINVRIIVPSLWDFDGRRRRAMSGSTSSSR